MEFRRLGRSGLNISEVSYGNWLTHGSQVEEELKKIDDVLDGVVEPDPRLTVTP